MLRPNWAQAGAGPNSTANNTAAADQRASRAAADSGDLQLQHRSCLRLPRGRVRARPTPSRGHPRFFPPRRRGGQSRSLAKVGRFSSYPKFPG